MSMLQHIQYSSLKTINFLISKELRLIKKIETIFHFFTLNCFEEIGSMILIKLYEIIKNLTSRLPHKTLLNE